MDSHLIRSIVEVLIVAGVAFSVARLLTMAIRISANKLRFNHSILFVINNVIWGIVLYVAGITIFNIFGLHDAANLTTISIIAISLLVQGLVTNFLYGGVLVAEHSFIIGDTITISGPEGPLTGVVREIDLRITKIQINDRQIAIIPNSNLATETIIIGQVPPDKEKT